MPTDDSALEAWADTLGHYAPLALGGVLLVAVTAVWFGWLAFENLWRAVSGWRQARRPAEDREPSALGYLLAHLSVGLGLAWVAVHGFAELAETLNTQDALARFDAALARSLHAHATPLGLWSFRAVAWLGGLPVMAALALVVGTWLWRHGQRVRLLGWIAALVGDGVLNTVLKLNFQRVRPSAAWPNPFVVEPGWSFPSGHAMGSLVAYGMLAYLLVTNETGASRAWRLGTVAGALALILAIGFSRLYLTVHFFSDVVAGYAAGGAWLVVCVTGTELARRWRRQPRGRRAPSSVTGTPITLPRRGRSPRCQPMEPDEFSARYPRLYHMAEADAWPSIQRHGLLSTGALLDLYGVSGAERDRIERRRRPDFLAIEHATHGRALIRDQKPMTDDTLAPVLRDGLSPADWYALLNARVFFWVEEERLRKLLGTYRHRQNIVLVLDTARVLADHAARITLSAINSGYSRRYAQPRGLDTFKRLPDFSGWRVGTNGKRTRVTVAECAVDRGLPEVERYLVERRGP